ncbi:MAG: hypothetical protein ABSG46_00010 [Candidatus Binataceae bacterium]
MALTLLILFLAVPGIASSLSAVSAQSPAPPPIAQAKVTPSLTAPSAIATPSIPLPQPATVIGYLGTVISWYRDRDSDTRLAAAPAEALFAGDNQRLADNILSLAFDAARAEAALISPAAAIPNGGSSGQPSMSAASAAKPSSAIADSDGTATLADKEAATQAEVTRDKARINDLQSRLKRASGNDRSRLNQAIDNAQSQLQLDQSRLEAISAIADFETNQHVTEAGSADTLAGQIDELQRSVSPPADQQSSNAPIPANSNSDYAMMEPAGLISNTQLLIRLTRKADALEESINQTTALSKTADQIRAPLVEAASSIYNRAVTLANQASSGDYATVREKRGEFRRLTALHKLIVPAILPLAKQIVLLDLYSSNLERWRSMVNSQIKDELRDLVLRLGVFAFLFAIVAAGSVVWRRLTIRYVQDFQRRQILMQMRRIAVGLVVALILIFGFASELGTLGTILGFAAAGIALALQNVILSLAGYFYASGRFGIRVADRIELSGISGDVIEIGLFRLTLMELSKDDFGFQPTGRVVVFPNSVMFQPNGNFFKQLPGSSFIWNELRLTLAPDCDYRMVEKKILEVVNEVFAHYRDSVQREYRSAELELNVKFDMPKPLARIELSASGLVMLIRYPVPMQSAPQTADEIARRLVDAIRSEPGLELATQGTPSLRPTPVAPVQPNEKAIEGLHAGKA